MVAHAIEVEEVLDIYADRFLKALPIGGTNIALYDKSHDTLRFIAGGGICMGPEMRSTPDALVTGPRIVGIGRSDANKCSTSAAPQGIQMIRPAWLAKELLHPFCEDQVVFDRGNSYLTAQARGRHRQRHTLIPSNVAEDILSIPSCPFLNAAHLGAEKVNGGFDWWCRIDDIPKNKANQLLDPVDFYASGTDLQQMITLSLQARPGTCPSDFEGLLNLNNPKDEVFADPRMEQLVFDRAHEMSKTVAAFMREFCFTRDGSVQVGTGLVCSTQDSGGHVIEAIAELAAVLDGADADESLAKAKELHVGSHNGLVLGLRDKLLARMSLEKETIDGLVREVQLGRKRTRQLVAGFAAISAILALEAVIVLIRSR